MLSDEEILSEYNTLITTHIDDLVKVLKVTDQFQREAISKTYRESVLSIVKELNQDKK